MKLAVPGSRRRIVAQHVVRAVGLDDARERVREVVGIDRGEAGGLVRERDEAVLRYLHLLQQPLRVQLQRIIEGRPVQLDRFCGHAHQSARIDGVEADIGARRRRNRLTRGQPHFGCLIPGEGIVDGVVDPFAEQEQRLAAAPHAGEKIREIPQLVQHTLRPEAALLRLGVARQVQLDARDG